MSRLHDRETSSKPTLTLLAALLLAPLAAPQASEFHIGINGSDAGPGTKERPFSTITRARDAVRELKRQGGPDEPVEVVIHGGRYFLPETTGITVQFSASSAALALDCPLISKSFIGAFPNAGQQLEDPQGNPMVVDKDIFGSHRNLSSPRVGPLEKLVIGKNVYRIGYDPFAVKTKLTGAEYPVIKPRAKTK